VALLVKLFLLSGIALTAASAESAHASVIKIIIDTRNATTPNNTVALPFILSSAECRRSMCTDQNSRTFSERLLGEAHNGTCDEDSRREVARQDIGLVRGIAPVERDGADAGVVDRVLEVSVVESRGVHVAEEKRQPGLRRNQ